MPRKIMKPEALIKELHKASANEPAASKNKSLLKEAANLIETMLKACWETNARPHAPELCDGSVQTVVNQCPACDMPILVCERIGDVFGRSGFFWKCTYCEARGNDCESRERALSDLVSNAHLTGNQKPGKESSNVH